MRGNGASGRGLVWRELEPQSLGGSGTSGYDVRRFLGGGNVGSGLSGGGFGIVGTSRGRESDRSEPGSNAAFEVGGLFVQRILRSDPATIVRPLK